MAHSSISSRVSFVGGAALTIVLTLALAACSSQAASPNPIAASATATAGSAASSSAAGSASGQSQNASASGGATVSSATVPGLGQVLVDGQGRTLYVFVPDNDSKVTCVSACATVWPPDFVANGQTPKASGSVKQSLLGSDPDPAGGQVVTYSGWPLYTYVADTRPGKATGQDLNVNGGVWHVIAPSGTPLTQSAA